MASASVSCAVRERRRTARPKATIGRTISGIAPSTISERRGEVATIMITAPMPSNVLRSAMDAVAPDGGLHLRGVGGEARDDLAGLLLVEEFRREAGDVGEDVGAHVGDHPLAQPV